MMHKRAGTIAVLAIAFVMLTPGAPAANSCARAVIVTLPGVTWEQVDRVEPAGLLQLVREGAAGSISVRTISSRTSYPSGFATLGAGTRVDAPRAAGASAAADVGPMVQTEVTVGSVEVLDRLADDAGYNAVPGALAGALDHDVVAIGNADPGLNPASPTGYGRWTTLAAADPEGVVDRAAVGPGLLSPDADAPFGVRTDAGRLAAQVDLALDPACSVTIVDHGDPARADEWAVLTGEDQREARDDALGAADDLLGRIAGALDFERDLLIVVAPTSPWWDEEVHLGVAVARGPGFDPGATLESASTRRTGIVTLPDVAPTVLEHFDVSRPSSMTGRPWFAVEASGDRIDQAIDLDRESIFIEGLKTPVSASYVIAQVLVYLLAIFLFTRGREVESRGRLVLLAQICVLAIAAFPITTYLGGIVDAHELGSAGYVLLLVGVDAALVACAVAAVRDPLDRLLVVTAVTVAVLFVDLFTASRLQINTVLGYSPVVAGRFAGLGNIAFAVLGASALLTGVLVAQKWPGKRWALPAAGALFAATVIVDGAPPWGSDVGGILALVPSLGLTWVLLSGRRPSVRMGVVAGAAALVVLGAFLVFDLSRPVDRQTHLARLFQDVRDRGTEVMADTVERKVEANVRLFRSSIWTYFVPPALITMALLLRRPRGRWQRLGSAYPRLRAGLVGGLVLAVVGFAVNDSGIVIPAVVLSFLVPTAVLTHLKLDSADRDPGAAT